MSGISKETFHSVLADLKEGSKSKGSIALENGISPAAIGILYKVKDYIQETNLIDKETSKPLLTTECVTIDRSDIEKINKKLHFLYKQMKAISASLGTDDSPGNLRISKDGTTTKVWYSKSITDKAILQSINASTNISKANTPYWIAKRYRSSIDDYKYSINLLDFQEPYEVSMSQETTRELSKHINLLTVKLISLTYFPNSSTFGLIFE